MSAINRSERAELWKTYVGEQTPEEFLRQWSTGDCAAAVRRYLETHELAKNMDPQERERLSGELETHVSLFVDRLGLSCRRARRKCKVP